MKIVALLAALGAAGCATSSGRGRARTAELLHLTGGSVQADSINSGLVTDTASVDLDPPGYRVSFINWSSGFRGSGLQIGDRILAIDGERVVRPETVEERQKTFPSVIGQYAESQRWTARGATDGQSITLTVRRRSPTGEGSQVLDIRGLINAERHFDSDAGRPAIGPGGPEELASDGFSSGAWSGWLEPFVRRATRVLDGGWQSQSMDSRAMLADLLDDKPRVDFLAQHYPGPFASAVRDDFEAQRISLLGRRYELDARALAYRQLGDQLAAKVAETGRVARDAFLKTNAAQLLEPFPAIDPIRGDRKKVTGKLVVLSLIRNRDWVSEAGHGYLVWGDDSSGRYFLDSYADSMVRVLDAAYRYRKYVSPQVDETYAIIARIRGEPRMLVIDGRAVTGLAVDVAAATIGDQLFVDATVVKDKSSPFAGEAALLKSPDVQLAKDASPRQVMEAFVAALENNDQPTFTSLFATWRAEKWSDGGEVIWYPYYENNNLDDAWVSSRQLILDRVYGARVVYVGDAQRILTGQELPKGPVVDQVMVELDHLGLFDGEYHAFSGVVVHRIWTLQRVDGGPWRIASVQGL